MSPFRRLALELQTSDRTLRRAAARGLIRARRHGPRSAEIAVAERSYIRTHWPLLRDLVAALRTEANVRLAVLFGSTARGTDTPESDIEVVVQLEGDDFVQLVELEERLSQAGERRVQVIRLSDAQREPQLLADILSQGRVLVDRDDGWRRLRRRRSAQALEREANRRTREAVQKVERFLAAPRG
jgi:predicted nucleotidyltransferase